MSKSKQQGGRPEPKPRERSVAIELKVSLPRSPSEGTKNADPRKGTKCVNESAKIAFDLSVDKNPSIREILASNPCDRPKKEPGEEEDKP